MHHAYMEKNAAVTLRLPMTLKKRLAARAKLHHRSLSAQAVRDLERVLDGAQEGGEGRFLGLYERGDRCRVMRRSRRSARCCGGPWDGV